MTRPRTKTIPGYKIQTMLPMSFPYLAAEFLDANFTEYGCQTCVEVQVRFGMLRDPYTLLLTINQAREADIIERV